MSVLRVLRLLVRGLLWVMFVLGAIETAMGAPTVVKWLTDAGLTQPHTLSVALAVAVTLVIGLLAVGPDRIKRTLAAIDGQGTQPSTPSPAPVAAPPSRRPDEPSTTDAELIETIRTLCDDIDGFIEQESRLGIGSYAGAVRREMMTRYQESGLRTRVFWIANEMLDRGFIKAGQRDRLHWDPINPRALASKRDELLARARLLGGF